MSKYSALTKYIPLAEKNAIGEWVIDTESDGTMEHPIHMPWVRYCEEVNAFIEDVHMVYDILNCGDYIRLLSQYGIEWSGRSMNEADVSQLPAEVICALLLGAARAERFCDGALLGFFKNGCIKKWLDRLSELDK